MNEAKTVIIDAREGNFAREMLSRIAFVRAFEAKAWSLTQSDPPRVAGSMHFCAGQEAVPLAAMAALGAEDQVFATYRGHGWALASGLDPRAVMGEICQKACGLNGGRAGSAYMMAPWTRFVGQNSIVGAGTTMACGTALANKLSGNGRLAIVSIGDGAMNQGAVHEAMAFASALSLPVIFVVENNGWSELTPTNAMFKVDRLAKRAHGYGIPAATVDGSDPFKLRDTFLIAAEQIRTGTGPALIECTPPRLWGHYHKDIEHYRSKADRKAAEARDPLRLLSDRIVRSGLMGQYEVDAVIAEETRSVEELTEEVMTSADPDAQTARQHVVALPVPTKARVKEQRDLRYIDAVNLGLRHILETDKKAIVYGEDVGSPGGVFGATRSLQKEFGSARVFDTPISENAIIGSAVGAAISGLHPIVEIMWSDFLFVALDQIINQAANIRYLTSGRCSVPLVIRTQQGATPGSCAQHSQSIEAILAHVPGIKVALAATSEDAYALLRAAAADPDPCIVIEARGLYGTTSSVSIADTPEHVGQARLHRDGSDAAIITWGSMVPVGLEAAEILSQKGIDVSVLDLRWLNPLDEAALINLVGAVGGKVLIAHEAVRTGGFAGEVAIRIRELCAPDAKLDIRRVTTQDIRMPAAPVLQNALLPNARTLVEAITEMCLRKQ